MSIFIQKFLFGRFRCTVCDMDLRSFDDYIIQNSHFARKLPCVDCVFAGLGL